MKQLKNYGRKPIKSLIVEDFQTGKVFKVTRDEDIENVLVKYSQNEITQIYNPTQSQKNEIYKLMERNTENNKITNAIDGVSVFIKVLPMLTDLPIDLSKEDDIELINEIINDPNEVFEMVSQEVNSIILQMNLLWIENLKLIGQMPDEIINILAQGKDVKNDTI